MTIYMMCALTTGNHLMKMHLQLLFYCIWLTLFWRIEGQCFIYMYFINIHPFIHSSIIKYLFEGLLYPSLNIMFQIIFPSNSLKSLNLTWSTDIFKYTFSIPWEIKRRPFSDVHLERQFNKFYITLKKKERERLVMKMITRARPESIVHMEW